MGTNYYWAQKPPCSCCNRPFPKLHIGKASAGWCFALHVYTDMGGPYSLDGWQSLFSIPGSHIEDEYGNIISIAEMLDIITNRKWAHLNNPSGHGGIAGPNNLLRAPIDGSHCIGHGSGTYDLFIGHFS